MLTNIYAIKDISIHAPREGSDNLQFYGQTAFRNFYPRSPRGERPAIAA